MSKEELEKREDEEVETNDDNQRRRRRRPIRRGQLKCPLCTAGIKEVSYKDIYQLKKYVTVKGKIIPTVKTGVCSRHQRQLTREIKRARQLALMPYVAKDI